MFYNLLLIKEKFLHCCSIHRQATSSGIEIDTISKIDFSPQIFRSLTHCRFTHSSKAYIRQDFLRIKSILKRSTNARSLKRGGQKIVCKEWLFKPNMRIAPMIFRQTLDPDWLAPVLLFVSLCREQDPRSSSPDE